jgi:hypothetical protein
MAVSLPLGLAIFSAIYQQFRAKKGRASADSWPLFWPLYWDFADLTGSARYCF